MPNNEIRFDISKLQNIKKELLKKSYVKVGILGSKNARDDKETNANIGLKHEFGSASENLSERSFLRMPLNTKLKEKLKEINKDAMQSLIKKDIVLFLKKLGVLSEEVIQNAFDTGGFGKWKPLSDITKQKKGFDKILIETTQLRKSITSEVVNK